MKFLKFHNYLMEGFRIDLKTFWAWICLTNALKLSESKYKAGLRMIIWGQNPLTFMIPIILYDLLKNSRTVKKVQPCLKWPE